MSTQFFVEVGLLKCVKKNKNKKTLETDITLALCNYYTAK